MANTKSAIGKIDLGLVDQLTASELTALIQHAEAQRKEKLEAAKEAVLAEARAKLAELGLSLEAALTPASSGHGRKRRSDSGAKVPTKYRGPNPGDEWTGRGRMPRWLRTLEAEGRKREEFRV